MLNLKKTAVAVLAFGSSAVFAGTMGPVCTPGNVTVPCARTAWDFGAQALYLQPTYLGQAYDGNTVNLTNQSASFQKTNPWAWGFQIEGSYHYNTGNDINLNWYHLDRSRNTLVPVGVGQTFVDTNSQVWGSNSSVSINGSSKWDAVNLEFGQHIDMGEFTNLRLHGGLEFARVKNSTTLNGSLGADNFNGFTTNAEGTLGLIPTGTAQQDTSSSTFNGVGPRVGSDLGYGWNNGLSVYAKGAMSMLVGTSKVTTTRAVAIDGIGSLSASSTTVSPELEAKLGATYTYAMAQGDLSLDLGWMFVNYFNVLSDATGSGVVRSDFGLQGPFLGLKWVGNVA
jgi:hypothetical protein